MIKRFATGVGAVAAIAALALGGSAIAGAQQSKPAPAGPQESTAPENSATDGDNVQSTTDPDPAGASEGSEKGEAPGSEKADGPDKGEGREKGETPGSEKPGDDGPSGHADEPGNPNADHRFQGVE